MRSDYALYTVAIIFFILTATTYFAFQAGMEQSLSVVSTAVLGLLFVGLGYSQRPKLQARAIVAPAPPTPAQAPPTPSTAMEVVKEEKAEIVVEAPPPKVELIQVKGIKEKRAAQLSALGISSAEDLAKSSAEDLGSKLKISPKITARWIEDAKKLVEKS
jgi:predicted flap endonuclease-1-like 5' DNA nuclease